MINTGSLKSLLSLWENLATSYRYRSLVDARDILECRSRTESEGLSFLTTVLPRIGKALDKFHATTAWEPVVGFKSDDSGFPLFLGVAIKLALRGDSLAVDCVRQLTLIFYKLEVQYDKEVVAKFLSDFKKVDSDLADLFLNDNPERDRLVKGMKALIGRVLANADPLDIRPYHGSGSTACRTPNYEKWHKLRYYEQLDSVFSYSDYFFYNPSHLVDELGKLEESEYCRPYARVVLVPKDSRGPRIISCEPAELLYIQQGLMGKLYEVLETHDLTRGFVNFTNQQVNRKLAHLSSITGDMATMDLSEASDRVSLELVKKVFPPRWVEALIASRSTHTQLPDESIVELNKFAPMGSSCCFPVEALVFWACATLQIQKQWNQLPTRKRGLSYPEVYVYGDDIIVGSEYIGAAMSGLEAIGLKVNREKTYCSGPFRESCGGDYHNGMDVTPVRIRKNLDSVSTDVWTGADLANSFIAKFGELDGLRITRVIEQSLDCQFPRTELPIPGTLRISPSASNDVLFRRRWHVGLQRFEYRVPIASAPAKCRSEATWCELLRKELARGRQPSIYARQSLVVNDKPLEPGFYVDPYSTQIKWGWAWLGQPSYPLPGTN